MLRSGGGLTSAQVAAVSNLQPHRSGAVILPYVGAIIATNAVAADTLYAHPIFVARRVTISGIQMRVGTAVPGVLGKMGLFRTAANGEPGELVAECNATVDMNTVALSVLQSGFAVNPSLAPGWYWPAAVFNGAAQPVTFQPTGAGAAGLSALIPGNSVAGAQGASGPSVCRLTVAQPYANAFPALFGSPTYGGGAPGAPIMGLVIA